MLGANKKKERKAVLRRTYKAAVQIEGITLENILFLSRVLIHLWNLARQQAEQWLINKDKAITAYSLNYWLTEARKQTIRLEDRTPFCLADASSDVEREVLRKLAGSYQSFFELKKNNDFRAKKPGEKKEEWFQTMSWSSLKITDGKLIVLCYRGESIEIPLKGRDKRSRKFTSDYLAESIDGKEVVLATLSRNRDNGEFELSLVVAEPLPEEIDAPVVFRAIDLGAGDIAVTDSTGFEYLIPTRRPDKLWMDLIASVEARAARTYWKKFARQIENKVPWLGREAHRNDTMNKLLDIGYHYLAQRIIHICQEINLPTELGIFHKAQSAKAHPLVYDFMEIMRPLIVDEVLLKIIRKKKLPIAEVNQKMISLFIYHMKKKSENRYFHRKLNYCIELNYWIRLLLLEFMGCVRFHSAYHPLFPILRHESRCKEKTAPTEETVK